VLTTSLPTVDWNAEYATLQSVAVVILTEQDVVVELDDLPESSILLGPSDLLGSSGLSGSLDLLGSLSPPSPSSEST
jgi:hypothetical protein